MRRGATAVDSSVWVDYYRHLTTPQTVWLDVNLRHQDIVLMDLSLCEVLQGLDRDHEFRRVRQDLLQLGVIDTGGQALALSAAENYRYLRRRGITVRKTIDTLIATCCIEQDIQLLHNDSDFDGFEAHLGLRVVKASRLH